MEFFRVIVVVTAILFLDASAVASPDDYNGYNFPVSQSIRHPIYELERSYDSNRNQPALRSHYETTNYPFQPSQIPPKYFAVQSQKIPDFRETPNEPELTNVDYSMPLRRDDSDIPSILNIPVPTQDPRIRKIHPRYGETYGQTILNKIDNYRPATQDDTENKFQNNFNPQISDYFNPYPERKPPIIVKTTRHYNTPHNFVPNIKFGQNRKASRIPDLVPHSDHFDHIAFLEPQPDYNNKLWGSQPQTSNERPAESIQNIKRPNNIPRKRYSLAERRKDKTTEKHSVYPKNYPTEANDNENPAIPIDFSWQNILEFFRKLFRLPSPNTELAISGESDAQPLFQEPVKGTIESVKRQDHLPTPFTHPHNQINRKTIAPSVTELTPSLSKTSQYPVKHQELKQELFPEIMKNSTLEPQLSEGFPQEIKGNVESVKHQDSFQKPQTDHAPTPFNHPQNQIPIKTSYSSVTELSPSLYKAPQYPEEHPELNPQLFPKKLENPALEPQLTEEFPQEINEPESLQQPSIFQRSPLHYYVPPTEIADTLPHISSPKTLQNLLKQLDLEQMQENLQRSTTLPTSIEKDSHINTEDKSKLLAAPTIYQQRPDSSKTFYAPSVILSTKKELPLPTKATEKSHAPTMLPQLPTASNRNEKPTTQFFENLHTFTEILPKIPKEIQFSHLPKQTPYSFQASPESTSIKEKYLLPTEKSLYLPLSDKQPSTVSPAISDQSVKIDVLPPKYVNKSPINVEPVKELKLLKNNYVTQSGNIIKLPEEKLEPKTVQPITNDDKISTNEEPKWLQDFIKFFKQPSSLEIPDKHSDKYSTELSTEKNQNNYNKTSIDDSRGNEKPELSNQFKILASPKPQTSIEFGDPGKKQNDKFTNNTFGDISPISSYENNNDTSNTTTEAMQKSPDQKSKLDIAPNLMASTINKKISKEPPLVTKESSQVLHEKLANPSVFPNQTETLPKKSELKLNLVEKIPKDEHENKTLPSEESLKISPQPQVLEKDLPTPSLTQKTQVIPAHQLPGTSVPSVAMSSRSQPVTYDEPIVQESSTPASELKQKPILNYTNNLEPQIQPNSTEKSTLYTEIQPFLPEFNTAEQSAKETKPQQKPHAKPEGKDEKHLFKVLQIPHKKSHSFQLPTQSKLSQLPYQENSNEYSLILTEEPRIPEAYKQQRQTGPSIQDISEPDSELPDKPQLYIVFHPKIKPSSNIHDLQLPHYVSSSEEEKASDFQDPHVPKYNNYLQLDSSTPVNQILDKITSTELEDLEGNISNKPYFLPMMQQENKPQYPRYHMQWPNQSERNEIIESIPDEKRPVFQTTPEDSQWSTPSFQIKDATEISPLPKPLLTTETYEYYIPNSIPLKLLPGAETHRENDQVTITEESPIPSLSHSPTFIDQPSNTSVTIADLLKDYKYLPLQYTPETNKDSSPLYKPMSANLHDIGLLKTTEKALEPSTESESTLLSVSEPESPVNNDNEELSGNYGYKIQIPEKIPKNYEEPEPDLENMTNKKRKLVRYILKLMQQYPSLRLLLETNDETSIENSPKPANEEKQEQNGKISTYGTKQNKIPSLSQQLAIPSSIKSTKPNNIGYRNDDSDSKLIEGSNGINKNPSFGSAYHTNKDPSFSDNSLKTITESYSYLPGKHQNNIQNSTKIEEPSGSKSGPSITKKFLYVSNYSTTISPEYELGKKTNDHDDGKPSSQNPVIAANKSDIISDKNDKQQNNTPDDDLNPSSSKKSVNAIANANNIQNSLPSKYRNDIQNGTKIEKPPAIKEDPDTPESLFSFPNGNTTISPKYKSNDHDSEKLRSQNPENVSKKTDNNSDKGEKHIKTIPGANINARSSDTNTLPSKDPYEQNRPEIEKLPGIKHQPATPKVSFNVLNDSTTLSPNHEQGEKTNNYEIGKPHAQRPETDVKKPANLTDQSDGKQTKKTPDINTNPSASDKSVNATNGNSIPLPSEELNIIQNRTKFEEPPVMQNGPATAKKSLDVPNDSTRIAPEHELGEKSNEHETGKTSSQNPEIDGKKTAIVTDQSDIKQIKQSPDTKIKPRSSDKTVKATGNANIITPPSGEPNVNKNRTEIEDLLGIKNGPGRPNSSFNVQNANTKILPENKVGKNIDNNGKLESTPNFSVPPKDQSIRTLTEDNKNTLPSKHPSNIQNTNQIVNPIFVEPADAKSKESIKSSPISGLELKRPGSNNFVTTKDLKNVNEAQESSPTSQGLANELSAPSILAFIAKELAKSLQPDDFSRLPGNSPNAQWPNNNIIYGSPNDPPSSAQITRNQGPLSENQDLYGNSNNVKQSNDEQSPVSVNNIIDLFKNISHLRCKNVTCANDVIFKEKRLKIRHPIMMCAIFEPMSQNFKPAIGTEDGYNEPQESNSIFGLLPTYDYEVDETVIDEIVDLERAKQPEITQFRKESDEEDTQNNLAKKPKSVNVFFTNLARALQPSDTEETEIDSDEDYVYEDETDEENEVISTEENKRLTPLEALFGTFFAVKELFGLGSK